MKQNILVTTDSVIFKEDNGIYKVLLVLRKNDPFKDQWALPGGFLEEDESLKAGALRELKEETGLEMGNLEQIGAFGAPGRDPRGRTISIAFVGKSEDSGQVNGGDDAKEAKWFRLSQLPQLAFDHSKILEAGRSFL